MKKRIDLLLMERGLAPSRERAQSILLAGKVLVDDVPVEKPGTLVSMHSVIRLRGIDHPYVSRGGIKLEAALAAFKVQVKGRSALDIGASTGGFSHALLLRQAAKIFAVDVGESQLDWKIRQDSRVVVLDKTNARNLDYQQVGQKVDLIVIDVSFISLEKILPRILQFAHSETDWITLIKPQFEVGPGKVGKGGIVTSAADQLEVVGHLQKFSKELGLIRLALIESPITGRQGNKEFLAHWKLEIKSHL
jgi:23S rRNA (cytidine1920-2'-O)/16S rRNA (cytidine1409-2'-O)-methyltransferase